MVSPRPSIPRVVGALVVALAAACAGLLVAPGMGAGAAPRLSGEPRVGEVLTASPAAAAPRSARTTVRWEVRERVTRTVRRTVNGRTVRVKRTAMAWRAIPGAGRASLTPSVALQGKSLRACARTRSGPRGRWSPWRCSRATTPVVAARSGSGAGAPAATPAGSPPALPPGGGDSGTAPTTPPTISYATGTLFTGRSAQSITPSITGGSGSGTFSVAGVLPSGVTFDQATGAFRGPAGDAWNFRGVQASAGGAHTCAVTADAGVRCWGTNASGQLGTGAVSGGQPSPVAVVGVGQSSGGTALSGVMQVVTGASHTCALLASGSVACWGSGDEGQLGGGSTPASAPSPVMVRAVGGSGDLTGITAIAAGGYTTCALDDVGGVVCWGRGVVGQLGNGTTTAAQAVPVRVLGVGGAGPLSAITQVAVGQGHACAVTTAGGLRCWGSASSGQLGNGATTPSIQSTPVVVSGVGGVGTLDGVAQVAVGAAHTCAVTTSGSAACWGAGASGQLGNGALPPVQSLPVSVMGLGGFGLLADVSEVAAGWDHTCVRTDGRGALCWGAGADGRLGNAATPTTQSAPVRVVDTTGWGALPGVAQVTTGTGYSCATLESGAIACWGAGADGQIGDGGTASTSTPAPVSRSGPQAGFPARVRVTLSEAAGSASAEVTLVEGAPMWFRYPQSGFTMGQGRQPLFPAVFGGSGRPTFASVPGTLPTGVTFDSATGTFTGPVASAWNFRATQVSAGAEHTCAVTTSGGVKCWGKGADGRLGYGMTGDQSTPVDVVRTGGGGVLSGVTAVTAGGRHTCALMASGGVKCWGHGSNGRLGIGASPTTQATPVDVVATGGVGPLSGITDVSAGGSHTCAVTSAGRAKCWGMGASGRLGNGFTSDSATPIDVGGSSTLTGVRQVSVGSAHSCAVLTSSEVRCWGEGGAGQLGNVATPAQEVEPVVVYPVSGGGALSGVAQVSAGGQHTCAVTTTGGVRCWGAGGVGQLGNGTNTPAQDRPVIVTGMDGSSAPGNVARVTAGSTASCALTTGGEVLCWGRGSSGELGSGSISDASTPGSVLAVSPAVGSLSGSTSASLGGTHACATDRLGAVTCWGNASSGRLGNGTTSPAQDRPVTVDDAGQQPGFPAVLQVTATDDGGTWTLGRLVLGTR